MIQPPGCTAHSLHPSYARSPASSCKETDCLPATHCCQALLAGTTASAHICTSAHPLYHAAPIPYHTAPSMHHPVHTRAAYPPQLYACSIQPACLPACLLVSMQHFGQLALRLPEPAPAVAPGTALQTFAAMMPWQVMGCCQPLNSTEGLYYYPATRYLVLQRAAGAFTDTAPALRRAPPVSA
jgi:hypothetical protein